MLSCIWTAMYVCGHMDVMIEVSCLAKCPGHGSCPDGRMSRSSHVAMWSWGITAVKFDPVHDCPSHSKLTVYPPCCGLQPAACNLLRSPHCTRMPLAAIVHLSMCRHVSSDGRLVGHGQRHGLLNGSTEQQVVRYALHINQRSNGTSYSFIRQRVVRTTYA